jgi:hypothetical protein
MTGNETTVQSTQSRLRLRPASGNQQVLDDNNHAAEKGTFSMLFGTAVAVRRMIGSDSFGFDRQGTERGEVDA